MGLIDSPRFRHRIGRRIKKLRNGDLNAWRWLGASTTIVAFTLLGCWGAVKPVPAEWAWVKSLPYGWLRVAVQFVAVAMPPLLCGWWLKFSERRERVDQWDAKQRHRRLQRKVSAGIATRQLAIGIRNNKAARDQVITRLLQAAAWSVESILQCEENRIRANLVLFDRADPTKMYVAGRSHDGRAVAAKYPREKLLAFQAVRDGTPLLIDNADGDPRCNWHGEDGKKYKTILAVPLSIEGEGYGSLTLDAGEAFLFGGRLEDIALQVDPYLGLLAQALGSKATWIECTYEPTHEQ